MAKQDEAGRWVTIHGARVFIRDGESATDAINRRNKEIADQNERTKQEQIAKNKARADKLNGKNTSMPYNGYTIEKDNTIDSDVYYARREDGKKFIDSDGNLRSIASVNSEEEAKALVDRNVKASEEKKKKRFREETEDAYYDDLGRKLPKLLPSYPNDTRNDKSDEFVYKAVTQIREDKKDPETVLRNLCEEYKKKGKWSRSDINYIKNEIASVLKISPWEFDEMLFYNDNLNALFGVR